MALTYGDLPSTTGTGMPQPQMRCSAEPWHGTYSAERGDYFYMPDVDRVVCAVCGLPMELGREVTSWERVRWATDSIGRGTR